MSITTRVVARCAYTQAAIHVTAAGARVDVVQWANNKRAEGWSVTYSATSETTSAVATRKTGAARACEQ